MCVCVRVCMQRCMHAICTYVRMYVFISICVCVRARPLQKML